MKAMLPVAIMKLMDQRFLLKDNTMMFLFHDEEFFNDVFLSKSFIFITREQL